MSDYDDYEDWDEFDFAQKNPERYKVAQEFGDFDEYMRYSKEMNKFKADKDENGESISGSKTAKVADYIESLDIEDWQKNILLNDFLDRKEDVDMSNYEDYGSWAEFDFAQKYPDKYAFTKTVGGYDAYKTYSKALNGIKSDKDANGKSISGSREAKVLNYINSLDADFETKIILYKSEYPGDDTYNYDIIDYLNNRQDLTYEEKVTIWEKLGFKVGDGEVSW
jgi:hypothetical protein